MHRFALRSLLLLYLYSTKKALPTWFIIKNGFLTLQMYIEEILIHYNVDQVVTHFLEDVEGLPQ